MRILFSIALGVGTAACALSGNAQTLFSYGTNPVSKEEFLRVYQKNNAQKKPDYSEKSVKEYLDLYALFRMKVKEAENQKLDTTASVKSELNNYKGQLARTYLSDKEVTKSLTREAYDRLQEEVHVAHILVALRPNDDTAKAYQKIDSIYKAITQNKADFGAMAREFSDDKGSGGQGGDIGYITALQVVYPFENAAYNTPVGQVSKPFRTQFGFHIVKVEDKRKSKGQVQVAQIMIASPKSKGEQGLNEAGKKIAEVQAKLKKGESFESLVKEYSEDKFSKEKQGLLEPFGVGRMTPNFEAAAFALNKEGDISQPITTEYGIHLLKLIKKMPVQSFNELQDNLARRVENDSRALAAKEAYQEKVKKQNGFKEYTENFDKLLTALPADTAKDKSFKLETFQSYTAPVFELGGKKYSQYDFMSYVSNLTRGNLMGNKNNAMRDLFKMYQNTTLNDMQQAELEKSNVEYRNLVHEYRDGILLFDLMDKNVWSKASKDTTGLMEFYTTNKAKYKWQPGFEGTVYQSVSEVDLNKLKAALDSGVEVADAVGKINTPQNPSQITQESGRFEASRFPVSIEAFKEGAASTVFRNEDGTYSMVFAHKVFTQASDKTLDEARGFAVADYQDYLEKKWNQDLKEKYPVKVEQKALNSIIK